MKKKLILIFLSLIISYPSFAVLDEADINITISELRNELLNEYQYLVNKSSVIYGNKARQHKVMLDIMHKCHSLSLVLYSQSPERTFCMTYAFKEVTKQYEEFSEKEIPYKTIISYIDSELERHLLLAHTLMKISPRVDHLENIPDTILQNVDSLLVTNKDFSSATIKGQAITDRDSCLYYISGIINILNETKKDITQDIKRYKAAYSKLNDSYSYMNNRFIDMQKDLFTKPTENYLTLLDSLPSYNEPIHNWNNIQNVVSQSEWHGRKVNIFILCAIGIFIISLLIGSLLTRLIGKHFDSPLFNSNRLYIALTIGFLIFLLFSIYPKLLSINNFVSLASRMITIYCWIFIATLLSTTVIRWKEDPSILLRFYSPILLISLIVFIFRVWLVRNIILQIIFPPLLIGTLVWISIVYYKIRNHIVTVKQKILLQSVIAVIVASTILSFFGYNFVSIILVTWLSLQIATAQTLYIIKTIVLYYGKKYRNNLRHETIAVDDILQETKGDFIAKTWFMDFMEIAVIPSATILCSILCVWDSLKIFDMTSIFDSIFNYKYSVTSYDGTEILQINIKTLILIFSLFFFFRYLDYLIKSLVKLYKTQKFKQKNRQTIIQKTDINLTLGNNLVGILVWGTYIILSFIIIHIPTNAITMIGTGLAAGLGMAMKDILNNFIYGLQLMSGRLRPGDWIECDGIRGKVTEIKYQCTQLETIDGAVISFLNTDLLTKNFKNLTRNDRYEYCAIKFETPYETDLNMVRRVLMEGLAKFDKKDCFGQDYVDHRRGTVISFNDFGEDGMIIQVEQYILVSVNIECIPLLKEVIFNILKDNGIELCTSDIVCPCLQQ